MNLEPAGILLAAEASLSRCQDGEDRDLTVHPRITQLARFINNSYPFAAGEYRCVQELLAKQLVPGELSPTVTESISPTQPEQYTGTHQ